MLVKGVWVLFNSFYYINDIYQYPHGSDVECGLQNLSTNKYFSEHNLIRLYPVNLFLPVMYTFIFIYIFVFTDRSRHKIDTY